jgi:hypothetical protein
MMECWNTGIVGALQSIILKNLAIDGINCAMDRKNINRALKAARLASSP